MHRIPIHPAPTPYLPRLRGKGLSGHFCRPILSSDQLSSEDPASCWDDRSEIWLYLGRACTVDLEALATLGKSGVRHRLVGTSVQPALCQALRAIFPSTSRLPSIGKRDNRALLFSTLR